MKLTLTYQGPLPPRQKGISPLKARLRNEFHSQIKAQAGPMMDGPASPIVTSIVEGRAFMSPAHADLTTAVELDVLLLTPHSLRVGDSDNRLKTLIDGLTRPANKEQMQGYEAPDDDGPTYCLLDDDRLVQQVQLDTRQWHGRSASDKDSLVVITARIVLGANASPDSPMSSLFLVI